MHIHILGICGTFMAGIAVLAKQQGHTVTGSDVAAYPPMSTQLEAQGITVGAGYSPDHLRPAPDCVVIGNALSRGNPAVEYVLNQGLPYISGPQWLAEHILAKRWVLAIAGTHGKTTTASMVAWILEQAGLEPGFLIGGIPENFGLSARLGESPFFVVEADEYDTAFFDKRSKFLHYHPRTLILNNLEFDHADIFPNLAAIQTQFHHLIRTVPGQGLIIRNHQAQSLSEVLAQGCWTPVESFAGTQGDWQAKSPESESNQFAVWCQGQPVGEVKWDLFGHHNMENALAAIACTRHAGVPINQACEALTSFKSVKRRLELRGVVRGIHVYDDFAHHPTAIAVTLAALRQRVGKQRIIAVLEPRSNTMRLGVHRDTLAASLQAAEEVIFYQPEPLNWSLTPIVEALPKAHVFDKLDELINHLVTTAKPDDHILIMSNGDFQNLHQRLLTALSNLRSHLTHNHP